jgi:hypothetical protein
MKRTNLLPPRADTRARYGASMVHEKPAALGTAFALHRFLRSTARAW